MKRLLRVMWYAALLLIGTIVIIATMQGIVCGLEALGVEEITSRLLVILFLHCVFFVVVLSKK